jgi:hypothetical protein
VQSRRSVLGLLGAAPAGLLVTTGSADAQGRDLLPGGRFDRFVAERAAAGEFSGTVLVAHRGKPVLTRSHGTADESRGVANGTNTSFDLASMTKSFTAIAVARLAQEAGSRSTSRSAPTSTGSRPTSPRSPCTNCSPTPRARAGRARPTNAHPARTSGTPRTTSGKACPPTCARCRCASPRAPSTATATTATSSSARSWPRCRASPTTTTCDSTCSPRPASPTPTTTPSRRSSPTAASPTATRPSPPASGWTSPPRSGCRTSEVLTTARSRRHRDPPGRRALRRRPRPGDQPGRVPGRRLGGGRPHQP